MIKSLLAAAALLCTASAFAAGNIVTDGSFEVGEPTGTYGYYAGIWGWNLVSGPSIEVRNALVGSAQQGDDYVELDSQSNSSMSQVLGTVAGQAYTLSFWYSNRAQSNDGYNSAFAGGVVPLSTQGLSYDVGHGGVAVGALPVNTSLDNEWVHYTTTFTATGATTLTFAALGTSDSWGTSLDNVAVTAVPEPAPLALMGAGLALLAGLARRRRTQG